MIMPADGHKTMRSEEASRVVNEVAEPPTVRFSKITLDYYQPILAAASEKRRPQRVRGAILESAPDVEAEPHYPDVAIASFGDTMLLEAVIGNDDRVRVAAGDLEKNPFRQICALRIKAKTGSMFVGTAWLIGPRALATAGHCVFLQQEGGWAESIEVIPAKFGNKEPLGRFRAKRFRAVDGWVKQQNRDFDYGVILLDDDRPGDSLGWFAVDAESETELKASQANISGYPADKDNANFQYFHARPVMSVSPTRLMYDIDTFGGQSGSPVWEDSASGLVAIGIHTNGGVSSNSGTRINDAVVENLAVWRNE
jgi:glutamyl endopeptidase